MSEARPAPGWRWHAAAAGILAVAGAVQMRDWFALDLLPLGDFAGYTAVIESVRDSLLRHGRVPRWCSDCFGGSTLFVSSFKEHLAFPLAVWMDAVTATKLMFLLARLAGGMALYLLFARLFRAPAVGVLAGYAFAFGAFANHQSAHLDVPISCAILPLAFLACVELLRRRSFSWALALGVLVALLFGNNWVQAFLTPFVFLLLLALRPWRESVDEDDPFRDRALAARWGLLCAVALCAFLAFGASHLAWTLLDAGNHSLIPLDVIAEERMLYIERSPFLFVNRDNWLGPWLAGHQPPGLDISAVDAGGRYLGGVAIAVTAAGWFAAREEPGLRRWFQVGALLLLFQYWLALGPPTLLWQLARSFHVSAGAEAAARSALWLLAAASLGAAAWLRGRAPASRLELLLGLALLAFFPTFSLWQLLARVVPVFAYQRAPGHFFDTAPFAFSFAMGVGLVALSRSLRAPGAARAAWAALALLLVVDFWPSTRGFSKGRMLAPLREARVMLRDLPGEEGTLRMGLAPVYAPVQSWLASASSAGKAWGWLGWQAGKHWPAYMTAAAWDFEAAGSGRAGALLAAGRLRYFLVDGFERRAPSRLPEPWRPLASAGGFTVWSQPDIAPFASAHGAWVLLAGDFGDAASSVVSEVVERNLVALHVSDTPPAALAERAVRVLRRADVSSDRWKASLGAPGPSPGEVRYRRPAPERISLEVDVGGEPAVLVVSEGFHPWWRARLDGEPVPLHRAQLAFMGVPVGPGAHRIDLRLERPAMVAAAEHITTLSWIGLAVGLPGVLLVRRARSRR